MPKIILKAPLYDDSGYAVWGRGLLHALKQIVEGTDWTLHVLPLLWAGNSFVAGLETEDVHVGVPVLNSPVASGDVVIHLTLPQEFKAVAGVRNIGVFTFEASRISHGWVAACNQMSEVWVPAHAVKTALLLSEVRVPVYVVPIGCDSQESVSGALKINLDSVETSFNFLCAGQWLPGAYSVDRKNIATTVGTFCEAFRGNKQVGMILKTFEVSQSITDKRVITEKVQLIRRELGIDTFPRVYLLHGRLTPTEMLTLYTHSKVHALLSMSHGEGWWNEGAEAALAGLPIIAPGYGAPTEYLQKGLYAEIPYEIAPVGLRWAGVYEPEYMFWSQPSVEDAKRLMHRCYDKYDQAKERAVQQQKVMETFTWNKIVEILKPRFEKGANEVSC